MAGSRQTRRKRQQGRGTTCPIPLRDATAQALDTYFRHLNGHDPGELYNLVLHEVEQPLFEAVLDFTGGNQSQAAAILGINRGTLRKKLRAYGLSD